MSNMISFILGLFSPKRSVSPNTTVLLKKDWDEIEILLRGGAPSQLKQALILADRSLDAALKDRVKGETMGDRLKNAKNLFHPQTYDSIWQAHKLRNSLVHESGFEAQHFMLRSSVEKFKSGIKDLGVRL